MGESRQAESEHTYQALPTCLLTVSKKCKSVFKLFNEVLFSNERIINCPQDIKNNNSSLDDQYSNPTGKSDLVPVGISIKDKYSLSLIFNLTSSQRDEAVNELREHGKQTFGYFCHYSGLHPTVTLKAFNSNLFILYEYQFFLYCNTKVLEVSPDTHDVLPAKECSSCSPMLVNLLLRGLECLGGSLIDWVSERRVEVTFG